MTKDLIKKTMGLDEEILEKISENQNIPRKLWDKFYKSNEEANKRYRKLFENLNPRIETKIAVKKIINSQYNPQSKSYVQGNSQLNILKYN